MLRIENERKGALEDLPGHDPSPRVPIVATVNSTRGEKPPNSLSPANTWENALSQNDSAVIVAVTDGIRTGICPARAEVTIRTRSVQ